MPKIVTEWVEKTKFSGSPKVWFVMTCGGEIGNAGKYNNRLATQKWWEYMGSIGVVLPDNYIIMFGEAKPSDIKTKFEKAEVKISEIAQTIIAGKAFPPPRNNMYDKTMSGFVNTMFYKGINGEKFSADEKCTACGKCVSVCPLNNVQIHSGKPIWSKNCTHCMACISNCPVRAIDYANKTKGKKPYLCNR